MCVCFFVNGLKGHKIMVLAVVRGKRDQSLYMAVCIWGGSFGAGCSKCNWHSDLWPSMIPLVPGVHVLFVSFLSLQFEYFTWTSPCFQNLNISFGLEYEDVVGGVWTLHFFALCTNLYKLLVSVTYVTGLVKNSGKSRLSEVWILALKGRVLTQASRKQRRWTFRKRGAVSCCHTLSTFKDLIDLLQWVTFWQLTFRTLEAPYKEAIQHGCDTKLDTLW